MKQHERNIGRRILIKLVLTIVFGNLIGCGPTNTNILSTSAPFLERDYQGSDLEGWEVVVGDGIYNAPGEAPVNADDIESENYGGYSEIRANIQTRRVM